MKIFATFFLAIFSFYPFFVFSELRIDITKGNLDPIPIAILKFNSSKQEEKDLSKNINEVIKNNLSRSGLFSVLPSKIFLNNKTNDVSARITIPKPIYSSILTPKISCLF